MIDPATGHMMDDVKSTIDSIASLTDGDREAIYSGNALSLFSLEEHLKTS